MACCNCQAKVEAPTDTGNPDCAPAWQSCTCVQTRTGTIQDEDQFDLDAISGSKDDYEPPRSEYRYDANSAA